MQQETSGCLPLLRQALEVGHRRTNILGEEIRTLRIVRKVFAVFVLATCAFVGGLEKKLVIETVIYG